MDEKILKSFRQTINEIICKQRNVNAIRIRTTVVPISLILSMAVEFSRTFFKLFAYYENRRIKQIQFLRKFSPNKNYLFPNMELPISIHKIMKFYHKSLNGLIF